MLWLIVSVIPNCWDVPANFISCTIYLFETVFDPNHPEVTLLLDENIVTIDQKETEKYVVVYGFLTAVTARIHQTTW